MERQTLTVALPSVSVSASLDASPNRPTQARGNFAGVLADRVVDGDSGRDGGGGKNLKLPETNAASNSDRMGKTEDNDKDNVSAPNDTGTPSACTSSPLALLVENPVQLVVQELSTTAAPAARLPNLEMLDQVSSNTTNEEAGNAPNEPAQWLSAKTISGLPTPDKIAISSVTERFPGTITAAQSDSPGEPASLEGNSPRPEQMFSRIEITGKVGTEQDSPEAFPVVERSAISTPAKAATANIVQFEAIGPGDANHVREVTPVERGASRPVALYGLRSDAAEDMQGVDTRAVFELAEMVASTKSSTTLDYPADHVSGEAENATDPAAGEKVRGSAPGHASTPKTLETSLNPDLQAQTPPVSHSSQEQAKNQNQHSTAAREHGGQESLSTATPIQASGVNPISTQAATAKELQGTLNVPDSQIEIPAEPWPTGHARPSSFNDSNSMMLRSAEATLPAPFGPVHLTRVIEKLGQSEMHIGFETTSFGSVQVHTIIRDTQVGLSLSNEKGDLRALIATEVPSLESSFRQHELRLDSLQFLNHSTSFGAGDGYGAGQDSRYFHSRPFVAGPHERVGEVAELAAEVPMLPSQGLNVHA
jgi:hypothetical protein